jgi:hypothetical protein
MVRGPGAVVRQRIRRTIGNVFAWQIGMGIVSGDIVADRPGHWGISYETQNDEPLRPQSNWRRGGGNG